MSARDAEYTEYVAARLSSLRRLAVVLCDDWQRADDLVQAIRARGAWFPSPRNARA